jgi:protein-tyrosine phosphatase
MGKMKDIHSHIIPGIDDGSTDLETSMELIRGLSALGFDHIIGTPHFIPGLYENTPEIISNAYNKLLLRMDEEQVKMTTSFATEYFLDEILLARLNNGQELCCLWDQTVLTEFSFGGPPEDIKEFSFALQIAGYQPVLAHPERYSYYKKVQEFEDLKDLGFMFQLNLLSLTTMYSSQVNKMANELLRHGLIDYIGSDIHNITQLNMLRKNFDSSKIRELVKKYRLKNAS